MQFLLIISHGTDFRATPEMVEDIHDWVTQAEDTGIRIHGNPLVSPRNAVTVRVRDGELKCSPGPAVRTDEMMAAYELIECEGMDDAIGIAAHHPMAHAATIEIRPVWDEMTRAGAAGGD